MKKIVIATAGWVFIGQYAEKDNGSVVLTDASCIRRWGTQKGLGQIAIEGPTKDTVMDYMGTIEIKAPAVIAAIDCDV